MVTDPLRPCGRSASRSSRGASAFLDRVMVMSFLSSDEAPFVFGAYASHLDEEPTGSAREVEPLDLVGDDDCDDDCVRAAAS